MLNLNLKAIEILFILMMAKLKLKKNNLLMIRSIANMTHMRKINKVYVHQTRTYNKKLKISIAV